MHIDRSILFNLYYNKHLNSQHYCLAISFHNNIIDQFLITVEGWCWSMIYIPDHQNNESIEFAMSEHLGLDTLILNLPVKLTQIPGFCSSYLAEKTSGNHINHPFLKNAQGCQLGTLQILILRGLITSNQLKPIVGPLLQG